MAVSLLCKQSSEEGSDRQPSKLLVAVDKIVIRRRLSSEMECGRAF